jgi:tetratricopeptide (TPR) repeat protein
MQDLLATAIEMHRAGQLAAAAQLYQKILVREDSNAEALHLLGVLRHQQGDHARAVELIGRAVALRPNASVFHANLAEAYRALGQFDRAAGCCRAALAFWPDYPEALCNLGAALQGLNKFDEAVTPLRRALELRPDFAVAHNNLGIVLRELGQLDEAVGHFRRAVELDASFAPARTNLGQALLDRGQAEEALPHCQEAVRLAPDTAVLHHNLGNAFRVLDRPVDARAAYLEALRLDPKLALTNAHMGLVLQREGQLDNALPWLKKATELEPENPSHWEWLAELHEELEEPGDALPCWERAVELDPTRTGAHLGLGWALQEEGRIDEAREHFLTGIRLQPDSGQARLNLGGLHEELGRLGEAEAAFREALQVQPNFAIPLARLATLLRGKLPEADQAALERRLADPELPPGPRARLMFGLSHVLDARGEYARAGELLKQANALTQETNRQRREYVPSEHEAFINALIAGFDQAFFDRTAGGGLDSRRPIFVFGLPRSGTTLIEQILASHSRIHGAGELRLARRSFDALPGAVGRTAPPRDCIADLNAESIHGLAASHLAQLETHNERRAEQVVDKMPDNYMYLGLLAAMFPKATFIHCRRDLRDIAVSCWMTDFRSIRWANDPSHIAHRFQQYRRVMDYWRGVLPVPIHEVDYEDTVSDLENVARRLIAASGQRWEPACLEFHRTDRPVRTASVTQVRQPVYLRSVARWRNYEPALGTLFAALE